MVEGTLLNPTDTYAVEEAEREFLVEALSVFKAKVTEVVKFCGKAP